MNDPRTLTSPAPADLLAQAMAAHGAGRLADAHALYEHLLAEDPQHPDGLHLLGVLQAQRGEHARAAELISQAIALRPFEAMFHNNLGNVCAERSRFDEAEAHYLQALELDAGRIDALNNLGVLWGRRQRPEDAEQAFLRVIELAPGFTDARENLAALYLRIGRLGDAVQQCCDALVVAPRNGALRNVLGKAYWLLGRQAEAIAVYRHWLEAEPDNPKAAFYLAACTGEDVPDRAPDAFVRSTFDAFANSFDAKLASLAYRAPQWVAEAVARHAGPPAAAWRVLDAGCGTGLCAPLLAPYAARLDGVDLSEGMLRKAQARGLYSSLAAGDLVAWLQAHPAAYELVVSADTLCYFGALEAFASAARAALCDGGLLCFTLESLAEPADPGAGPGYRLQGSGRYSHRRFYVEAVLAEAGLVLAEMLPVELRQEAGEPVQGWVVSAFARHAG